MPSVFPLLPILTTPAFSPSLVHVAAYPPVLLRHMAGSLSTPPPPLSPPEKFWNVFLPVASRTYDVEELVFGNSAEGSGAGGEEIVVELLVRGGEPGEITLGRRKKGVERTLEGWVVSRGAPCELKDLASLKTLFTSKPILNEVRTVLSLFTSSYLSFIHSDIWCTGSNSESFLQPYTYCRATTVTNTGASALCAYRLVSRITPER